MVLGCCFFRWWVVDAAGFGCFMDMFVLWDCGLGVFAVCVVFACFALW